MADKSAIEWTDATVNFWWGCTKVGPGCDGCYAETWDKRVGGAHWGLNVPRRKIESAGKTLHRLNRRHQRVFIQSMSDLFDLEVPFEWFSEAWREIYQCNNLEIQIVTKRVSAVEKRLASLGYDTWPKHAGLIITVVNQAEADRDIPRLLALKAKFGISWVGLSVEPMLGPIDLQYPASVFPGGPSTCCSGFECGCMGIPIEPPLIYGVDWVICGGESGKNARPMHPDWPRSIRDQCEAASVPFLFKQWGEYRAPAAFEDPDRSHMIGPNDYNRVGKKRAGRLLDGIEHNGYPATHGRDG